MLVKKKKKRLFVVEMLNNFKAGPFGGSLDSDNTAHKPSWFVYLCPGLGNCSLRVICTGMINCIGRGAGGLQGEIENGQKGLGVTEAFGLVPALLITPSPNEHLPYARNCIRCFHKWNCV